MAWMDDAPLPLIKDDRDQWNIILTWFLLCLITIIITILAILTFEHFCCAWWLQQTPPHAESKQKPWSLPLSRHHLTALGHYLTLSDIIETLSRQPRFTCSVSLWEGRIPNTPSCRPQVQQSFAPFEPWHWQIVIHMRFNNQITKS